MLFRRIAEHVKNENWFAVFIDFVIVVSGVFLGIQIGNWNDARSDRQEYQFALERFSTEVETNLSTLTTVDEQFATYFNIVSDAFDALQTCEDTPENRETVNAGLAAMTGTYGLSLRSNALHELTTTSSLLAQQTAEERKRFTSLQFYFDLVMREASYVETLPLEERMQNNPIIGIGAPVDRNVTYTGADYSRRQRSVFLKVPLEEACQNDQLVKSFYTWERWQGVLPALSRTIRTEYTKTQELLAQ